MYIKYKAIIHIALLTVVVYFYSHYKKSYMDFYNKYIIFILIPSIFSFYLPYFFIKYIFLAVTLKTTKTWSFFSLQYRNNFLF